MQIKASLQRRARICAGFSLLELVIVAALMFVMFTVYWSRGSASYQRKQKAACQRNLQTVYLALQNYASDHDGKYPSIAGAKSSEWPLSLLVPQYTVRTELFICPGSKDKALPSAQSFRDRRISYAYLMGLSADSTNSPGEQWLLSDRQVSAEPKAKGASAFSVNGKSPGNNHDKYGGVILFMDGSAESTENKTGYELSRPAGTTILNPTP